MKEFFRNQGAIALILIGSVAKGTEREDSDQKEKDNITSETVEELCTYEGGYFDVKYMTKGYLKELSEKGSEPARNTFTKSRILFCNDTEIEGILPRIPVFQTREKDIIILFGFLG